MQSVIWICDLAIHPVNHICKSNSISVSQVRPFGEARMQPCSTKPGEAELWVGTGLTLLPSVLFQVREQATPSYLMEELLRLLHNPRCPGVCLPLLPRCICNDIGNLHFETMA